MCKCYLSLLKNNTHTVIQDEALISLSSLDKSILGHLIYLTKHSPTDLARLLRVKENRVRYSFERLIDSGVIRPLALIDVGRVGYERFTVFASTYTESGARSEEWRKTLVKDSRIAFAAEVSGTFDIEIGSVARNASEAAETFDTLLCGKSVTTFRKEVLFRLHSVNFERRYLGGRASSENVEVFTRQANSSALDQRDLQILSWLAEQPNISQRALASAVGVSLPTINQRLQKLRRDHIFRGILHLADFGLYGATFASILVSLKLDSRKAVSLIGKFALENDNVVHLVRSLGTWDIEIGVEGFNLSDIHRTKQEIWRLLREYLSEIEVVQRSKVLKFTPFPVQGL